jgi:hypothetical protein
VWVITLGTDTSTAGNSASRTSGPSTRSRTPRARWPRSRMWCCGCTTTCSRGWAC